MRGGLIRVRGNAGNLVGAAYRGSAKGMRGGTIIVDGNAGNEIGLSMQGGVITIGGEAGNMIGFNMTNGTIIVFGNTGIRPGAGMHGGTIALLGETPTPTLSSFRRDRTGAMEKLRPIVERLSTTGFRPNAIDLPAEAEIYVGDMLADGRGEIYLRHAPTTKALNSNLP
jgi:formylmethanofuran dehydrogenase subunit C